MGQVCQTNDLTRRRFLCGALSVFGVVAGARPLVGRSQDACVRQEALGLLERQPAFDLHTHPGSFYRKGFDTYGGDSAVVDQFQDMVDGRLAGGFCSIVADIKILAIGPDGIRVSRAFETGEAWADYLRQATALRELVALAPARLATGPSDLPPRPGPEVAAFMAVEGGDCLEGRVSRVEELYRDGVRSVQLVHYAQNDVGDLQTADPVYGSPAGVATERRCFAISADQGSDTRKWCAWKEMARFPEDVPAIIGLEGRGSRLPSSRLSRPLTSARPPRGNTGLLCRCR